MSTDMTHIVCTIRTLGPKIYGNHTIWAGYKNFEMSTGSHLAMQVTALSLFPRLLHLIFLRHLGQPLIVSSILTGILFGPTVLGDIQHGRFARSFFPLKSVHLIEILSLLGSMFYLFKIGVKTDPFILIRAGRKAWAVGSLSYLISFFSGTAANVKLYLFGDIKSNYHSIEQAKVLAMLTSGTSFPVMASALNDLNLLNSELGRLALSSSMVTDLISFVAMRIFQFKAAIIDYNYMVAAQALLSFTGICSFGFLIVRPFSLWVIRRTPEGKQVHEGYISCLFIALLAVAFTGEYTGQSSLSSAYVLGLAIPDGPPLGSSLVEKIDYLAIGIFMPVFLSIVGLQIDLNKIHTDTWKVEYVIAACIVGKIVAVILVSLCSKIPLQEAFVLGLMMNFKGIVELSFLNAWIKTKGLDPEYGAVMLLNIVFIAAVFTPLIKFLYDPSERYLTYKKKSILYMKPNSSFRVLACIHSHEDVPTILRLLESSNPTEENPLNVHVLYLIELVGRAAPLLISHRMKITTIPSSSYPTKSEQIINAFRQFEKQKKGLVRVSPFTNISPYISMHNDILTMAVDMKASIIIFPFHLECDDNTSMATKHSLRVLIGKLLNLAPCSVGLLVDRSHTGHVPLSMIYEPSLYNVVVFFIGGRDDREALAYAMLMVGHPFVFLSVVRFVFAEFNERRRHDMADDDDVYEERMRDNETVNKYKSEVRFNVNSIYREVKVEDSVGIVKILEPMKEDFDLFIVGRRQYNDDARLKAELEAWNEFEELGIIGDILASSDFRGSGSVLVVQQTQGAAGGFP